MAHPLPIIGYGKTQSSTHSAIRTVCRPVTEFDHNGRKYRGAGGHHVKIGVKA